VPNPEVARPPAARCVAWFVVVGLLCGPALLWLTPDGTLSEPWPHESLYPLQQAAVVLALAAPVPLLAAVLVAIPAFFSLRGRQRIALLVLLAFSIAGVLRYRGIVKELFDPNGRGWGAQQVAPRWRTSGDEMAVGVARCITKP
jgi:hypothetical protein